MPTLSTFVMCIMHVVTGSLQIWERRLTTVTAESLLAVEK